MKQAVILAAGEGERLRPFTVNKPKVMLSTADRPVLQYIIEALAKNGIRNIVIVVGYRKESIFDWLSSGERFGVDVKYAIQEQQLGTAHALVQAQPLLGSEFMVLPGDNFISSNTISEFINARPSSVMVKSVANSSRYGIINIRNNTVNEISMKPERFKSNIIDTGIYVFSRDIFNYTEGLLDIPDVLKRMLEQGCSINAVETHGTWMDIVYPWDMLSVNYEAIMRVPTMMSGNLEPGVSYKGKISVGEHTTIRSNSYIIGPVIIGSNCDIGPNVCLLPATSISDNVTIGPFTEIKNSVICSDINIGAGCIIDNSIIDRGCTINANFIACSGQAEVKIEDEHHNVEVGAMIGEGCSIGHCVSSLPGTTIGNYSKIQAFKLISGRIHDKSLVV